MELLTVNQENIEKEHICCALTDKKGENCVELKKAWMKKRFEDGLVFKKGDIRGKLFIEYIPAEKAWAPIIAEGYMHINCFWIAGQYKGQGYANTLLTECIKDAKSKGMRGLTILSSSKKKPFLSDPQYLKYKGFQVADTAEPYFELLYLPFTEGAPVPRFQDAAKSGSIPSQGMVLYFTNQCPHSEKYAQAISDIAQAHGQTLTLHKFETTNEAQNSPSPFTTYSFFYQGKFVTNEILSEKKFEKFLEEKGL